VNRDEVREVEEKLGVPLDEFIAVGIEGLQSVAAEIELAAR
jgi:predicted hydrolase (HD superfamily)